MGCSASVISIDLVRRLLRSSENRDASWLQLPPLLCDGTAPSARLGAPEAQAPCSPRTPPPN